MQRHRYLVLLALLGSLSAVSLGQETPAPREPAPSEQPPAAPSQTPAPGGSSPPAAGSPSEPQQRKVADESFIPSEELSADEEVTFPVDI